MKMSSSSEPWASEAETERKASIKLKSYEPFRWRNAVTHRSYRKVVFQGH